MKCKCGFTNAAGAKFCGRCGSALAEPRGASAMAEAVTPATAGGRPRRGLSRATIALVAAVAILAAGGYWWMSGPPERYKPDNGGFYPISVDGKYGFMDRSGESVIPPQFDATHGFADGLAAVRVGTRWGYIDTKGMVVITPQFDVASNFRDGRAVVSVGSRFGVVDKQGKFISGPVSHYVGDFDGGVAPVVTAEGSHALMSRTGEIVASGNFVLGSALRTGFSEGLAPAQMAPDGKFGFIDASGEWAVDPQFDNAMGFSGGLAPVIVGGRMGYVDRKGKFVVNPRFDAADEFYDGYARFAPVDGAGAGKWGFIDTRGQVVIEPAFLTAGHFSEGLAPVQTAEGWGFVDSKGSLVVAAQFDTADSFQNGLARVTALGKEAYITAAGAFVVDPFPGSTIQATRAKMAADKSVSILTTSNLFAYNGRDMDEWRPLFDMLKEVNATITEAHARVDPNDYDVVFWDACRSDNSLVFPRLRELLSKGKVVVLTGTNSCFVGRYSSQVANDVLREFGMELTTEDPGNLVATSSGTHAIMNGVKSFLTWRSPDIRIIDESRILRLANSGEKVMLAASKDEASGGMLIAAGLGETFLFGVHDKSSGSRNYEVLQVMKNVISHARSLPSFLASVR